MREENQHRVMKQVMRSMCIGMGYRLGFIFLLNSNRSNLFRVCIKVYITG
jgi:hypothetical protein